MCNLIIKPMIKRFREQDMDVFGEIYATFGKLILYYSRKLRYEDAVQELTVFLLERLYDINIDLFENDESFSVKKYLAVSLRNKYIYLSKQNQKYQIMSDELYDYMGNDVVDFEESISLSEGFSLLSERQRRVIKYRYIYEYTDFEIAQKLNISRQAVNRLRSRGLAILKDYYTAVKEGL